jgi:hypothetical protein
MRYLFFISILATLAVSCEKSSSVVSNPYSNLKRDTAKIITVEPDPTSLAGIHKNILVKTCANSGCHDGTFEPDFRTAESSYNTMINQTPIKPNPLQTFNYRVVPGNADASMLIHRLTVDLGGNSGIMPLVVNPGNDYQAKKTEYIQNIKDWINAGAPDLDGKTRAPVNFSPQVLGITAKVGGTTLNRGGKYEPIEADANANVTMYFSLTDDKVAQESLTNMQIAWSVNPLDYSTANFVGMSPVSAQLFDGIYGNPVEHKWSYTFNTTGLVSGQVIWFRMTGNDGGTSSFTLPNDNSMFFLKKYFAIKIK